MIFLLIPESRTTFLGSVVKQNRESYLELGAMGDGRLLSQLSSKGNVYII